MMPSLPTSPQVPESKPSRAGRRGLVILLLALGGFVAWAATAPLDEGVPSMGQVAIDTKRKQVQHPTGGVVARVLVREGDLVKEGQLLIKLDDTTPRSAVDSAKDSISAYQQNIIGLQGQIQGLQQTREIRRTQLELVRDEMRSIDGLVKDGYAPRVQLLALQRQETELLAMISDMDANEARLRQQIQEVRFQMASIEQTNVARIEELSRTEIRAPAEGQVVGLIAQTVGGVIGPGQILMEIVPEGAPLLLEARVDPTYIDRVRAGSPVDVRFSTFAGIPQLVVEGEVLSISKDALVDDLTKMSYYLARVELTPAGNAALEGRRLQPGMPVEVIIKTGERTLLEYMINPLTKRVFESLKEE